MHGATSEQMSESCISKQENKWGIMCQRLLNSLVTYTQGRAWEYRNRKDKFSLLGKYLRIHKQSVVKSTIPFYFNAVSLFVAVTLLYHRMQLTWKAWRIHCDGTKAGAHYLRQWFINPTRRLRSCPGCFMPRNVASPTGPRTVDPPLSLLLYTPESVRTLAAGQNYISTHKMRLSGTIQPGSVP